MKKRLGGGSLSAGLHHDYRKEVPKNRLRSLQQGRMVKRERERERESSHKWGMSPKTMCQKDWGGRGEGVGAEESLEGDKKRGGPFGRDPKEAPSRTHLTGFHR
jgi:hypothetical protein